jgi:hypothetical protein
MIASSRLAWPAWPFFASRRIAASRFGHQRLLDLVADGRHPYWDCIYVDST